MQCSYYLNYKNKKYIEFNYQHSFSLLLIKNTKNKILRVHLLACMQYTLYTCRSRFPYSYLHILSPFFTLLTLRLRWEVDSKLQRWLLSRDLGAMAGGVELSAISYGAEVGATLALAQSGGKYFSATSHGAVTYYLGATICGADPRVQKRKSF